MARSYVFFTLQKSLLSDLFDKLDEHKAEYKLVPRKLNLTAAWYTGKTPKEMAENGTLYRPDKSKALEFCYDRDVMERRIFNFLSSVNKAKNEKDWSPGIRSLQIVAGGMAREEGKTLTSFFNAPSDTVVETAATSQAVNFVKVKTPVKVENDPKAKSDTTKLQKPASSFFAPTTSKNSVATGINFVKSKTMKRTSKVTPKAQSKLSSPSKLTSKGSSKGTSKKSIKVLIAPRAKGQKSMTSFLMTQSKMREREMRKKEIRKKVKMIRKKGGMDLPDFDWSILKMFSTKKDKYSAYVQMRHMNCKLCNVLVALSEFKHHIRLHQEFGA